MIALIAAAVGWALVVEWRASSSTRRSLVALVAVSFLVALAFYYVRSA